MTYQSLSGWLIPRSLRIADVIISWPPQTSARQRRLQRYPTAVEDNLAACLKSLRERAYLEALPDDSLRQRNFLFLLLDDSTTTRNERTREPEVFRFWFARGVGCRQLGVECWVEMGCERAQGEKRTEGICCELGFGCGVGCGTVDWWCWDVIRWWDGTRRENGGGEDGENVRIEVEGIDERDGAMRVGSLEHFFNFDSYAFSGNACSEGVEDLGIFYGGSGVVDECVAETTCESDAAEDTERVVSECLEGVEWCSD